jgi:hypothetical protein
MAGRCAEESSAGNEGQTLENTFDGLVKSAKDRCDEVKRID